MTDIIDPSTVKLGKKAAKFKRGVPAFSTLIAPMELPTAPAEVKYSVALKHLGLMKNDVLGDCTIAGIGHAIQTWTSLTRPEETVLSDDTIVGLYSRCCGYRPGDPFTDNGGFASDVLQFWYNNPVDGHALSGFASIRPGNRADFRDSIWLFGSCYIGLQLPTMAQNSDWDIAPGTQLSGDLAPGSWGGHLALAVDYDADGVNFLTWGTQKKATWAWLDAYCDEAYALLSKDWIEESGHAPPGFNFAELEGHMKALRH